MQNLNKSELLNIIETQQLEIKKLKNKYKKEIYTLNFILKNLPGSVYWKNKEGVYLGQNSYAKKLTHKLGFSEVVLGKTDYDLFPKVVADNFRETDLAVLSGKNLTMEEVVTLPNGKKRIFLSSKIPLPDRSKNIVGVLGISIDITTRKKAEDALKLAKEKAEAANQAKTKFLENMRHDIRTPLSGIVGCAHLIQMQSGLPKKVTAFADDLVLSSEALLGFLNKILESITVSSGEIPLLRKQFNLKADLEQIVRLNKSQAVLKGLELSLDYDETIPTCLRGDGVRAQRIILELLTNALKYTDKGFIKVSARLIKNEKHEAIIELRVSDTGMGIPEDKHKEVFDRFTRLTPSYQGIYPGTGLGLSVVKQFVEDLNGEIHIESEVGKGTTFICVIPFQESLSQDETPTELSEELKENSVLSKGRAANEALASEVVNANGSHILVVEDNMIAVMVAQNVLSALGCRIDTAPDGKTAVEKIEKNHYDLILMDMGLPDDDGCEVTRRIRLMQWQKNPSVPIIGLTAQVEDDKKQNCLANGMNAVFNKPLTPEKASEILSAFISHKGQSQRAIHKGIESLQSISILNIEQAVKLVGKKEVVKECLDLLVSGLNKELDIIKQQHKENDWQAIRNMAHKWKGGASYCCANRLEQACEQLAAVLRTESLEEAEVLYQQLIQVAEETKEAARKAIA
ncbi:ATP-binding protein [Rickettsiella endosymbiont of Dermanyssus gallinae]|uniref:ATP-binding protein n=1 Tax=Rickettsiella endosymbiont of Dermanyssus gallinae TaxID=2856608 RepID=UPI001C534196|nr:ATP-binding protein [Rickettsiella endosymbiont of Dermanyssus gallinae]